MNFITPELRETKRGMVRKYLQDWSASVKPYAPSSIKRRPSWNEIETFASHCWLVVACVTDTIKVWPADYCVEDRQKIISSSVSLNFFSSQPRLSGPSCASHPSCKDEPWSPEKYDVEIKKNMILRSKRYDVEIKKIMSRSKKCGVKTQVLCRKSFTSVMVIWSLR